VDGAVDVVRHEGVRHRADPGPGCHLGIVAYGHAKVAGRAIKNCPIEGSDVTELCREVAIVKCDVDRLGPDSGGVILAGVDGEGDAQDGIDRNSVSIEEPALMHEVPGHRCRGVVRQAEGRGE
jgi:hypothetical protein